MMFEIEVILIAKTDLANSLHVRNIDSHTYPPPVSITNKSHKFLFQIC